MPADVGDQGHGSVDRAVKVSLAPQYHRLCLRVQVFHCDEQDEIQSTPAVPMLPIG